MLQRSDEGDAAATTADESTKLLACVEKCGEDTECAAACILGDQEEEDNKTNERVKSGDLAITAKATEARKVVVPGVSDTDTITFKSSEEVEITKVVLERYGYSDADLVDEVRLEDQEGNVIADGKSLSKDKATLTIKKDYRNTDGTLEATIVVSTTGTTVGGTIGFKVVDVESSAKNLNLDDYTPYTYDTVAYSGATVTVDIKGTQKDYNYEEGESYEIARLKVKAGPSIINVKGFTLKNAGNLDMDKFLKKLTVKVDGKDVDGVKYSVNKDDQLVISFDEMTIDMNKSKLFVVYATLEDFDAYGDNVAYYLESKSDINATEKKTGARLQVAGAYASADAISHAFKGGKIKLSNEKIGKIDASQGAEDVVVARGTISISEPINKIGFTVSASGAAKNYVTALRMFVGNDEFEAKKSGNNFSFSNVEIAESGEIEFRADILDNDSASGSFVFTPNFNKDSFNNAKYDRSRDTVQSGDVNGSISFNEVTIQAAKATLKNTLTDDVEFLKNETNTGLVFKGTYTAKKALVNLNKFYISGAANPAGTTITYTLYVNGEEVASVDGYGSGAQDVFDDFVVEPQKSVDIEVVAEVEAYGNAATLSDRYLVLGGVDEFNKDVEEKATKLMTMKIVEKGSVNIEGGVTSKTVLYKAKNQKIAEFTVKPTDGSNSVEIESISFQLAGAAVTTDDVDVIFGDDELEADNDNSTTFVYSDINKTITEATTVKVVLNEKKTGTITLSGFKVNDKTSTKEFVTRFEPAIVKISSSDNLGGTTKFHFEITKDSDITVSDLELWYDTGAVDTGKVEGDVDNSSVVESKGIKDEPVLVKGMKYHVSSSNYVPAVLAAAASGSATIASGDIKSGTVDVDVTVEAATAGAAGNRTLTIVGDDTSDLTTLAGASYNFTAGGGTVLATGHSITITLAGGVDASSASGMAPYDVCICKDASCGCTDTKAYPDFFLVGGSYAKVFASNTK